MTSAPVVGKPIESAANVMPASCWQVASAEEAATCGCAAGCAVVPAGCSLHAASNSALQRSGNNGERITNERVAMDMLSGICIGKWLEGNSTRVLATVWIECMGISKSGAVAPPYTFGCDQCALLCTQS